MYKHDPMTPYRIFDLQKPNQGVRFWGGKTADTIENLTPEKTRMTASLRSYKDFQ